MYTAEKPTLEKSWEVIMKEVNAQDEALLGGWKEDIDTLLVFVRPSNNHHHHQSMPTHPVNFKAGLFSAVVTAFTTESYQWLSENPEDTTVALLKEISQQMRNGTSPATPAPFEVLASDVRINTLWFLSLIIALVDALFGLLCKQWLREHRRPVHTRTPKEALALRWLRNKSLEKWHVTTIRTSLPILLELALFLFLAGLVELLWTRHPVPFAIALTIVGLAGLFYIGTTIIPSIEIIRQAVQVTPKVWEMSFEWCTDSPVDFITALPPMEFVCPYKSPQAWAAFRVSRALFRSMYQPLSRHLSRCISQVFGGTEWHNSYTENTTTLSSVLHEMSNWPSVDREAMQRTKITLAPPFYELYAFQSLVAELRDTPVMIPHLQNVLETFPLDLVMPVVLNQWFFLPDREWTAEDIEVVLIKHDALDPPFTTPSIRPVYGRSIAPWALFNQLIHYNHVLRNLAMVHRKKYPDLVRVLQGLCHRLIEENPYGASFPVPFHLADNLLKDGETFELGMGIWNCYKDMEIAVRGSENNLWWHTLADDIARYIVASSSLDDSSHTTTTATSLLFFRTPAGCDHLNQMHDAALRVHWDTLYGPSNHAYRWMEAIDIGRRVQGLPEDHFKHLPGCFPIPLSKLEKILGRISSTDLDRADFAYLDSFRENWDKVSEGDQGHLVQILSQHINNYSRSDTEWDTHSGSKHSPLIMSSAGLNLISFVNHQVAEDSLTFVFDTRDPHAAWQMTLKHVLDVHPELPSDYFMLCSPRPGSHSTAKVTLEPPDDADSAVTPRDARDSNVASGKSRFVPHAPKPDEDKGALVREHKRAVIMAGEGLSEEGLTAGNLGGQRCDEDSRSTGERKMGGPDADDNV
ncbi:hypothetical protein PQX77_003511 [Marasmius sp. AFHP31]|nr:hypothetical protein PQX77_003511 [Marasmius sp. AFHP31]